ncbi:MAG: prenyltransferase/squalene oxidase repeat-containing protein [Dissulfurimicrobium hydrothermale]|uniref:prenyltransferase/squalene oxidase repeat-containing protein n=1 Tax=Dissulfurimicrobium hydrothermale TaxID=1750598 RepID=UPI003C72AD9A
MPNHLLKTIDILPSVSSFVLARRKDTGGFAATPRLPATIEDTYHAVNIFGLIDKFYRHCTVTPDYYPKEDGALLRYFSIPFHSLPDDPKTVFRFLKCLRIIGLDIDDDAILSYVSAQLNTPFSLQRWYYLARILNEVLDAGSAFVGIVSKGPRYFTWRTVDEARMGLYLARIGCGIELDEIKMAQWLKDCQNEDGGFGFLPQTTSYIENCHFCLDTLLSLGVAPKDADAAFDFIMGCHTAVGGFARNGMAAPFLDATWHAVASLSLIASSRWLSK